MDFSNLEVERTESPQIDLYKENIKQEINNLKNQLIEINDCQKILYLKQDEFEKFKAQIKAKKIVPKKFSSKLKNFVLSFKLNEISKNFRSKHVRSIFVWVLLIVSLSICCFAYITNSLVAYFSYEVVSNIRINYFVKDENAFPAVTFCGWESHYPIDEGIFHCKFNNKDCDKYDIKFEKTIVMGFGLSEKHYCIRFNGVNKTKGNHTFLLKSQANERFDAGLSISFLVPDGVEIYYSVHENNLVVRSEELINSGLPGRARYSLIHKTKLDKLGEPYNPCDEHTDTLDNQIARDIAARESDYNRVLCFNLCVLYFIEKECNCSLEYQLWTRGNDTCLTNCVLGLLDSFDYNRNCKMCPVKCDTVLYELQLSTQPLNDYTYFLNILKEEFDKKKNFSNYTFEQLNKKLILINIKFWLPQSIDVIEMPKTSLLQLFGDLGGFIGVLFGFSFIGFFEVLEMILNILTVVLKKNKN